ncbi:MAG: hypothetical protein QM666_09515, partial [Acinetobacter sp.]
MSYQYHDESVIKDLPENTIFVFGSDLAGRHQEGAARIAHLYFGAILGVARGWSGQSYAIPTLNEHLQRVPLSQIQHYIEDFKIYTKNHINSTYFITALGCGQAGYDVADIAPLFQDISTNVIFPESFRPYVENNISKIFPDLSANFLHQVFSHAIILSDDFSHALSNHATLDEKYKTLAL